VYFIFFLKDESLRKTQVGNVEVKNQIIQSLSQSSVQVKKQSNWGFWTVVVIVQVILIINYNFS
jgi:hypothetical protein